VEKRLFPLWPGSSPGRFIETSPGVILFHQKSGFPGILDQTGRADSKYLEFKKSLSFMKILCYYLGLKKEVPKHRLWSANPGWRIISTN
jgi:hypothetical protein